MANDSVENTVINAAGGLIAAAICAGCFFLLQQIGLPPFALSFLGFTAAGAVLGFVFLFRYYLDVLGSGTKAKGSKARESYEQLRDSLSQCLTRGADAGDFYARRLESFLNAVDRFCGDIGEARSSGVTRAFGLVKPAHIWTAASFDRCLLIALVYPIAAVFLIWVLTGHVGPAEHALQLAHVPEFWKRALAGGGFLVEGGGLLMFLRSEGWRSFLWFVCGSLPFALDRLAGAGIGLGANLAAFAVVGAFSLTGTTAVASALAIVGAFSLTVAVAGAVPGTVADTVAGVSGSVVGIVAVGLIQDRSIARGRAGTFLWLFMLFAIAGCYAAARFFSNTKGWLVVGPLALFLGFLTLLNAPFDWASFGLTRALLRKGIELRGFAPYGLALLDALLATVEIVLLAITMVVAVDLFGVLEAAGHGSITMPVRSLLAGIAKDPWEPGVYWVYGLLLSTMVPSIANLAIGAFSWLRSQPWLARSLLQHMPAGKSVPVMHRSWIAFVLTSQWFVGGAIALALQWSLVWLLIGRLFPAVGWDILTIVSWVADLHIPQHIAQLFP